MEESMRQTVLAATIALTACAALGLGCGSNTPSSANSFTNVYTEIIQPTCSNDFCHYNGEGIRYGALDMSSKVRAFWSLVGQPCMGPNCYKQGTRVLPGDPDNSVMYQKLSADTLKCGSQMPADTQQLLIKGYSVFSGPPLAADQMQLIHDWIQEGALNN
jgi:hypothetical protein